MTDADSHYQFLSPAEVINSISGMDEETNFLSLDTDALPPIRMFAALRRADAAIRRYQPYIVLLDCFETIGAPAGTP